MLDNKEIERLKLRARRQLLFEQAFKNAGHAASDISDFPKFMYFTIQDMGGNFVDVKMEIRSGKERTKWGQDAG